MECNKDEATRAKSIAEAKLEQRDFLGAKKFALKAQTLYPGLDGISQMLTTLDVYVSAENKIGREVDWYGVLGVNPSADDETIKKQYRKLALMLHPDKNNSIGADGAFKLISEAWSLLSDKAKRLAYNQRRGCKIFQQKVPTYTGAPSAPSKPSQFFNPASRTTTTPKPQKRSSKVPARPTPAPPTKKVPDTPAPVRPAKKVPSTPTAAPSHQRTDTFWTMCGRCTMQYEFLNVYRNCPLRCPNCQVPFVATEIPRPINFSKAAKPVSWERWKSLNSQKAYDPERNVAAAQKPAEGQAGPSSFRNANFQQGPSSGTANAGSTVNSIPEKAANVVQQAQDKPKRPYTESHASAGSEGCFKKRKLGDDSGRYEMHCSAAKGDGGFNSASTSRSRSYEFSGTYHQPNSTRELTPIETRKILMEKARKEILQKLTEFKSETKAAAADKEKSKTTESNNEKFRHNSNVRGHDDKRKNQSSATRIADKAENSPVSTSADNAREKYTKAVTMSVPDPDFHDFDLDRNESSFADYEVWAAYDNEDGMPRFYALVSQVISRSPFKLRISWLNSRTTSEFSNLGWVDSGFYKTCGEFWVGKYETCTSINAFSQKVNWSKGPRGSFIILPQKGDFWAIYRNWSADWDEHTPDEVVHKYDMVMVLDDYREEQGVSVAPLVKMAGFRTVFLPDMDSGVTKRIPKEETYRFSHRVPHHFLTREEAPNAPEGSVELDPAATPLELLQMIPDDRGSSIPSKQRNC